MMWLHYLPLYPYHLPLEVMKKKLEEDSELQKRTILPVDNILELLAFCLNNTYFVFQDTYYEQNKGAAMGSPVSPIIANIFMEAFERKAIATALHPPRVWRKYVDDTWVIQQQEHQQQFLQHINTVDVSIQFTVEEGKRRWLHTFSGHCHQTRRRWKFYNRGVQKTHPH